MKSYQSFITFIVFFTAGFYILDQRVSIPFLSASLISLIIFGVFLIWDNLLWKQKRFFIPHLAKLAGLHDYPDLNGKWKAQYYSSYKSDATDNQYVTNGDGEIVIKQTYSSIFITGQFSDSDSDSFVATLKQKENGSWFLIYGFRNKPKSSKLQNSLNGGMHEGFCYLELKDDKLTGYYTNDENRKTRGQVTLIKQ